MLTQQHTQEGLSRSYVYAISSKAGVNLEIGRSFDYGFDGTFRPLVFRGNRRVESSFPLEFQLKCTTTWVIEDDVIRYDLESKNYNDLVTREPEGVGAVLILVCIPQDSDQWIHISEDYAMLKHCCYFHYVSGEPHHSESSTKRIRIPRANVLTDLSLIKILQEERERKVRSL
jgi:hypothetical protein